MSLMTHRWRSCWRDRLTSLLRSDSGSVAVEIVIIVPLMMFLLLGFSAFYLYLRTQSAIEHTAFTLADTLGQMTSISSSNSATAPDSLGYLWNAATVLAAPYTIQTKGAVFITSVCDMSSGSCASNNPPSMNAGRPGVLWRAHAPWNTGNLQSQVSSASPLPSTWPFRDSDSALIVEVYYSYDAFALVRGLWPGAPGVQTFYERIYVRPRNGHPLGTPT
jgi:Flp pilus assembly protein TadG